MQMCTGMCLPKMHAKDGERVWELLEDRAQPGPGAGRGRTPPHGRQHVQAGAWGAQPAAPALQPGEAAGRKAGEGKRERRRLGGRCWHLSTSADERSSTCRCAHGQGPPWQPRPPTPLCMYTSLRCRSQTVLCHLLIPPLLGPHPAQHPKGLLRNGCCRSPALSLCSGPGASVVLLFSVSAP